jgi:hypothetical protein
VTEWQGGDEPNLNELVRKAGANRLRRRYILVPRRRGETSVPTANFPDWLQRLASASLIIAILCAVLIVLDEIRHPQKMWIMNAVWPLTALFGSVLWLVAYWKWGRPSGHGNVPFAAAVLKGASHCGAGCALGDLVAEWLVVAAPAIAIWFGWQSVFADKTFAVWILDFLLAFLFGIAFQYFTIKPMRQLSAMQGIAAAVKADVAAITAWQIGMYGVMALIQFGWFAPGFGGKAPVVSPEFWFAMQLAMLAGFVTAYPVNWLLIRIGWKERM